MSQEVGKVGLTKEVSVPVITNSIQSGGQKRLGPTGILPRRGGRKKTLSLNPEEREALENLIEEVIIDGGMGDFESASSDEEDNVQDDSKDKTNPSSNIGSANNPKALAAFKMSKKFYPGQLKVALKHMTDLPPRFSRKLKKAEKYLEMNAVQKQTAVSTSIKEEDEEEVLSVNISAAASGQDSKAMPISPKQSQSDKEKNKAQKEKTQKDLKKTIRSLLTDLDQYVDEKDRTSISLDLPGAVSCADLERESLGMPLDPPETIVSPLSSSSKVDGNVASKQASEACNVEKQKGNNLISKTFGPSLTQYNPPTTLQFSLTKSSSSSVVTSSEASRFSGIDNPKHPAFTDKSHFQQYPSLTTANYMDGSNIIVPVQQLLPQVPPMDFSVPPPSPFQFSAPYGLTSGQDSFNQNSLQFQPQFGFVELSTGASLSSHTGPNYASAYSTTPVLLQPYNTMPVISQAQQIPSFSFANNPSFFVSRFNYPSQPANYFSQFQTQPTILNSDSSFKPNLDYHAAVASPHNSKHGASNPVIGNPKAPFRMKPNANFPQIVPKTDIHFLNQKGKQYKSFRQDHQPVVRPELPKQAFANKDSLMLRNLSDAAGIQNFQVKPSPLEVSIEPSLSDFQSILTLNEIKHPPDSGQNVDEDVHLPLPGIMPTDTDLTSTDKPEETSLLRDDKLNQDEKLDLESTGHEDHVEEDLAAANSVPLETDEDAEIDPSTVANLDEPSVFVEDKKLELDTTTPVIDIDLGLDISEIINGKTGLDVVLGQSFMTKLNDMFVGNDSNKNCSVSNPVFLSTEVLKDIFMSISSSSDNTSNK